MNIPIVLFIGMYSSYYVQQGHHYDVRAPTPKCLATHCINHLNSLSAPVTWLISFVGPAMSQKVLAPGIRWEIWSYLGRSPIQFVNQQQSGFCHYIHNNHDCKSNFSVWVKVVCSRVLNRSCAEIQTLCLRLKGEKFFLIVTFESDFGLSIRR